MNIKIFILAIIASSCLSQYMVLDGERVERLRAPRQANVQKWNFVGDNGERIKIRIRNNNKYPTKVMSPELAKSLHSMIPPSPAFAKKVFLDDDCMKKVDNIENELFEAFNKIRFSDFSTSIEDTDRIISNLQNLNQNCIKSCKVKYNKAKESASKQKNMHQGFLKSAYELLSKETKQNEEVDAFYKSVYSLFNNEEREKEDKEMKAFLKSVGIMKQRVNSGIELINSEEKKKQQQKDKASVKLSEDCQNDINSAKADVQNAVDAFQKGDYMRMLTQIKDLIEKAKHFAGNCLGQETNEFLEKLKAKSPEEIIGSCSFDLMRNLPEITKIINVDGDFDAKIVIAKLTEVLKDCI